MNVFQSDKNLGSHLGPTSRPKPGPKQTQAWTNPNNWLIVWILLQIGNRESHSSFVLENPQLSNILIDIHTGEVSVFKLFLIERSELLFLSYLVCCLLLIFVYVSSFRERFYVTSNVQVLSYPVTKYLCLTFLFPHIPFLTS